MYNIISAKDDEKQLLAVLVLGYFIVLQNVQPSPSYINNTI